VGQLRDAGPLQSKGGAVGWDSYGLFLVARLLHVGSIIEGYGTVTRCGTVTVNRRCSRDCYRLIQAGPLHVRHCGIFVKGCGTVIKSGTVTVNRRCSRSGQLRTVPSGTITCWFYHRGLWDSYEMRDHYSQQ
jgi:hypothetical protein